MTSQTSNLVGQVTAVAGKSRYFLAILLLGTVVSLLPNQAQAQTTASDTWKSVAIIGGSTAAGAYIGHRVAGRTGAYVGAAAGATAGYAIDRHRRQNEYNNGYYGNYNGYYNDAPYQNGAYGYPYGSNYQSNDRSWRDNRDGRRR
jgi:hypothetical protein